MEVLTHNQKLLTKYLSALGMTLARRTYILGILWEEEATLRMLQYIAETKETDQEKLLSMACKISGKHSIEIPDGKP